MIRTLAAALATSTCIVALATPAAAQTREYNIPAGSLKSALDAYVRQSGRQVVYRADQVRSARSPGTRGQQSAEAALAAILSASGFTTRVDGNLIAIVRVGGNGDSTRSVVSSGEDEAQAAEIVVTGTNIRKVGPIGSSVTVVDRTGIEKSGYATVQDVLKTLPQNFGGGVSEDNLSDGTAGDFNRGSAVNLRGLGVDSTLVLLNGRRLAPSGTNGVFVDLSNIPTAALDRIEVLTDGASAIYGSDAVGGVVNMILRRDYRGAESQIRLGTLSGDATEFQASQIVGLGVGPVNLLVGYQHYERDALKRADRKYAASDDLRPFGGSDFRSVQSSPGNVLDPFLQPAFAIPSGQDGRSLTTADLLPGQSNLQDIGPGVDLLPYQNSDSAFATLNADFSDRLTLSGDAFYSVRDVRQSSPAFGTIFLVPSSNPFFVDPFGGSDSIAVAYNFENEFGNQRLKGRNEAYGGAASLQYRFAGEWQAQLTANISHTTSDTTLNNLINGGALDLALADSNPVTAFNPFADGAGAGSATIEAIRTSQIENSKASERGAVFQLDGPLFSLGGGDARLALGVDARRTTFSTSEEYAGSLFAERSLGRTIYAAYGELALPLFGSENAQPLLHRLSVSLAGRYEHYSDFGSTFNPKVGLSWSPARDLTFRGTWGTSFKAPRLADLNASPSNTFDYITLLADPSSSTGFSNVLFRFGRNPDLKEETADTFTLGLDYKPAKGSGPQVSINYFRISYSNRIAAGGPANDPFSILLFEDEFSPVINRSPTRAQLDAICNSGFYFGSVATCLAATPAAIVDERLRNLGVIKTTGLDFSIRQPLILGRGEINVGLSGTYVIDFKRAFTETSPLVELVDTVGNVPALRLRGDFQYTIEGSSVGLRVNYIDAYRDVAAQPVRRVSSWTTLDFNLSYDLQRLTPSLRGTRLVLSVNNLLNANPPFVNLQSFGYDTANADPYGRFASIQFVKSW